MMESSRQIMAIGNHSALRNTVEALSRYDWSIFHPGTLEEARAILSEQDYRVGLVFLDEAPSSIPLYMEKMPDLYWISIIENVELLSDETRDLIYRCCFAYHSGSLDAQYINTLIESALSMAKLSDLCEKNRKRCQNKALCMVGDTPVMQHLYRTIRKVASVDAPVLITGKSGTGKELTARAIHELSSRRQGPFNAINCGALPAGLIQSELFGHEKGAFTGANQRQIGIIENSSNGTLFLDEIGDLPLEMQVNLLRFLERLTVFRVGGQKEIPVDVRVLAATHVDLEKAIEKGEFREDLFHRLNVLQVRTPALKEHPEDIEPLANFFFQRYSSDKPAMLRGFSQESLVVMQQYHWPGNIREMVNRVRRSMIMCEHRLISPGDLGLERRNGHSRDTDSLQQARDSAECEAIRAALARNKYKILHAARELGIARVTLYRLLEKHGIDRNGVQDEAAADFPSTSETIQLT
ncbi:sigma-54 dependent transcriptional regulator [Halomonas saccharevitans]|uniref:Sigma-54 dependent transcriptional regulator n=1 Tax=Halomonas saccharevitans TaxID=416872 RepID=A0ABU3NCM0_9GAMM|nr:sigma-54 dependent transcriptional regulator [Halomonas saccharevitans]MDT8878862.1 sigma-54 dependent transcriptional regulator [Halomonas saccharevitans]